jgi:poly(glycerol-phosphate) alpha-glucosyltransferase
VLEAWAYGLPVLMTAACNLAQGFKAAAASEISKESEAMSSELATFFRHDDEVLRNMGQRGRKLVETQFTWDRISEQMLAIYAWLVQRENAPDTVRFMGLHRDA